MHPNKLKFALQTLIILLASVALVTAQASCDVDVSDVIEQVEETCDLIDGNQVCYGNYDVTAVAQDNAPTLEFDEEGDLADVAYIRSLFLSGLNPEEDIWGIARMRLIAQTSSGNQDINLLLFGDVEVETAVEETTSFDIITQSSANVRNTPRANGVVLESIAEGESVTAIGRLEDNSWVRVDLEDGGVGWVFATLIAPADESNSIEDLPIQDSADPYFGPMQAFYFTETGESQCGNLNSNGLLIQTPEGAARVTLLINEVSIELIPGGTGATALITGSAEEGMTVSIIEGNAEISTGEGSYYVNPGQETTIELGDDLSPIGAPTIPVEYDFEEMSSLPVLPVFYGDELPLAPVIIGGGETGGGGGGGGNGNGNANGRGNANGNGNANGQANGQANGN